MKQLLTGCLLLVAAGASADALRTDLAEGSLQPPAWSERSSCALSLSVEAVMLGGRRAFLYWSGSSVANVDVFKDGVLLVTTANDGHYQDFIGGSGAASINYWVCEAGSTDWYDSETCSNVGTAVFEGSGW